MIQRMTLTTRTQTESLIECRMPNAFMLPVALMSPKLAQHPCAQELRIGTLSEEEKKTTLEKGGRERD